MKQEPQQRKEAGGVKAFKDALKTTAFLLKVAMVLLLFAFLFSNVKNLEQYEKAVVLRFGVQKGSPISEPGLHFAWPYPIDQVIIVPAGRTQSLSSNSFMFQETRTDKINEFLKPGVDGYLLTADGNILHCESTLKYQVEDIEKFIFSSAKKIDGKDGMKKILRSLLDNSVLKASAKLSLNEALDNKELVADSKLILQKSITELELGVRVELLDLKIMVPKQVEASRLDVKNAEQDAARLKSESESYRSKSVDDAESAAGRVRDNADVWAAGLLSRSEADLNTLKKLIVRYRKNPQQIKEMLLRDTMVEVIPKLEEVFLFDSNKQRELRLTIPRKTKRKKEEKEK